MKTGLVFHNDYLKHKQLANHPENPARLSATQEYFLKTGLMDMLYEMTPDPAEVEDVARVHSMAHINYVKTMAEAGCGRFAVIDPDTYLSHETYNVALLSAGGAICAGESVWKGEVDNCFALIRPPGHHASRNQATGFCYFDNISIMARYLQHIHGVKRICIFDWDAHAPNGTMGTFYNDPSILNISIHQDPHSFYPGHGFIEQMGEGPGKGYTINFPVPAGTADPDYLYFINEYVVPRVRKFRPQLIAVAAGQDSHQTDFISQLNVTDAGYAHMTQAFIDLAEELCSGKLVLELEGGYNLKTLPKTNHTIVSTLLEGQTDHVVQGEVLSTTKELLMQLGNTLKGKSLWPDAPDYSELDLSCE
ncbi:MAG: histone deacetylase [Candidatus Altiarchaeales archaeon]|nr:histone deacetylase [Candidatus Altiarchaeales archaeon]